MLSIILLSYYSKERIAEAYSKVSRVMETNNIPFEFIVIDDGSQDESYALALELEKSQKNFRAYQLSRNYSSNYAAFAGLSICSGDCAAIIPDDEQQPYSTLVEMYRLWEKGEKVIIPFRQRRDDGFMTNLTTRAFYSFINRISEVKFPKGGADTFLIDRELIDLLNGRIHPINTAIVTEVLRLGFSPSYIPYDRSRGVNKKSRWTLKKKIRFFKDIFFSGSTWPIRIITWMGVIFAFAAFCMIIFYGYIALFGNPGFWGEKLPGWTSMVVIISFFSGIILFSLGIIAEYIWRIYEEVKGRPGYIIRKKENGKEQ
jgi:dolichol-phosphate mannosyltransferase